MGIVKVKSKAELIKERKENSQWGYVWGAPPDCKKKRLIIEAYNDGSCYAVDGIYGPNYLAGSDYVAARWFDYELIEEPKQPVYKHWTKQPFESMFEAQEWEFRCKAINSHETVSPFENMFEAQEWKFRCKAINSHETVSSFNDDGFLFVTRYYSNAQMFDKCEMRKRDGEWQPCGELVTE